MKKVDLFFFMRSAYFIMNILSLSNFYMCSSIEWLIYFLSVQRHYSMQNRIKKEMNEPPPGHLQFSPLYHSLPESALVRNASTDFSGVVAEYRRSTFYSSLHRQATPQLPRRTTRTTQATVPSDTPGTIKSKKVFNISPLHRFMVQKKLPVPYPVQEQSSKKGFEGRPAWGLHESHKIAAEAHQRKSAIIDGSLRRAYERDTIRLTQWQHQMQKETLASVEQQHIKKEKARLNELQLAFAIQLVQRRDVVRLLERRRRGTVESRERRERQKICSELWRAVFNAQIRAKIDELNHIQFFIRQQYQISMLVALDKMSRTKLEELQWLLRKNIYAREKKSQFRLRRLAAEKRRFAQRLEDEQISMASEELKGRQQLMKEELYFFGSIYEQHQSWLRAMNEKKRQEYIEMRKAQEALSTRLACARAEAEASEAKVRQNAFAKQALEREKILRMKITDFRQAQTALRERLARESAAFQAQRQKLTSHETVQREKIQKQYSPVLEVLKQMEHSAVRDIRIPFTLQNSDERPEGPRYYEGGLPCPLFPYAQIRCKPHSFYQTMCITSARVQVKHISGVSEGDVISLSEGDLSSDPMRNVKDGKVNHRVGNAVYDCHNRLLYRSSYESDSDLELDTMKASQSRYLTVHFNVAPSERRSFQEQKHENIKAKAEIENCLKQVVHSIQFSSTSKARHTRIFQLEFSFVVVTDSSDPTIGLIELKGLLQPADPKRLAPCLQTQNQQNRTKISSTKAITSGDHYVLVSRIRVELRDPLLTTRDGLTYSQLVYNAHEIEKASSLAETQLQEIMNDHYPSREKASAALATENALGKMWTSGILPMFSQFQRDALGALKDNSLDFRGAEMRIKIIERACVNDSFVWIPSTTMWNIQRQHSAPWKMWLHSDGRITYPSTRSGSRYTKEIGIVPNVSIGLLANVCVAGVPIIAFPFANGTSALSPSSSRTLCCIVAGKLNIKGSKDITFSFSEDFGEPIRLKHIRHLLSLIAYSNKKPICGSRLVELVLARRAPSGALPNSRHDADSFVVSSVVLHTHILVRGTVDERIALSGVDLSKVVQYRSVSLINHLNHHHQKSEYSTTSSLSAMLSGSAALLAHHRYHIALSTAANSQRFRHGSGNMFLFPEASTTLTQTMSETEEDTFTLIISLVADSAKPGDSITFGMDRKDGCLLLVSKKHVRVKDDIVMSGNDSMNPAARSAQAEKISRSQQHSMSFAGNSVFLKYDMGGSRRGPLDEIVSSNRDQELCLIYIPPPPPHAVGQHEKSESTGSRQRKESTDFYNYYYNDLNNIAEKSILLAHVPSFYGNVGVQSSALSTGVSSSLFFPGDRRSLLIHFDVNVDRFSTNFEPLRSSVRKDVTMTKSQALSLVLRSIVIENNSIPGQFQGSSSDHGNFDKTDDALQAYRLAERHTKIFSIQTINS